MTIKFALIGVEKSGKTSLLRNITGQAFSSTYLETMGTDIRALTAVDDHGQKQEFRFKDFAGKEKWLSLNKSNINADIYFLVIDPTQDLPTQFTYFDNYLLESIPNNSRITPGSICNIIISKSDLLDKKSDSERETFQKSIADYQDSLNKIYNHCEVLYTSAKNNTGNVELLALTIKQFLAKPISVPHSNASSSSSALTTAIRQTNTDADSSNGNTVPDYASKFIVAVSLKPAAQAIFESELALAGDNLKAIEALVAAAEPYLNEHKNPRKDKFFGIHNTATWQHCLKLARDKGLAILSTMATQKPDAESLIYWEKQSLFSSHRSNSIFAGAFGKTHAQKEIGQLLEKYVYKNRS